MSNVFSSKGKKNCNLIEWSKKYKTIYLNKTYKNSNYQRNDQKTKDEEVLIINYENKGI